MYYSNQLYLKANADCTLAFFVPFTTLIAIIYKYKYLLEIYTVENLTLKHSISCGRIKLDLVTNQKSILFLTHFTPV